MPEEKKKKRKGQTDELLVCEKKRREETHSVENVRLVLALVWPALVTDIRNQVVLRHGILFLKIFMDIYKGKKKKKRKKKNLGNYRNVDQVYVHIQHHHPGSSK